MNQIVLEAEVGEISAELLRRGIPSRTKVHAYVELVDDSEPPKNRIAQAGKAFDWLAEEPDLYSEADLIDPTE